MHASRDGQPRGHKKIQFRQGGTYHHVAAARPRSCSYPGLVRFREQALTEGVPPAGRAQDDLTQKAPAAAQLAARPGGMFRVACSAHQDQSESWRARTAEAGCIPPARDCGPRGLVERQGLLETAPGSCARLPDSLEATTRARARRHRTELHCRTMA